MASFFDRFRDKKKLPSSIWPSAQNPKKSFFSKRRLFLGGLFSLIISALIIYVLFFRQNEISVDMNMAEESEEAAAENGENKDKKEFPALEAADASTEKYQSENFQISQISFGGDATLTAGDSENLPIEIYNIKTDSFLNDKDNESKIAVSWKSNKMTISEITYSLAGGGGSEIEKEDDFGFNHNVILAPLEEGSAYVFSIKSYDRWGNSRSFGYYGAYSSAKADSIFELIGKTFGETFGWAINR